jgi:hypothetical protein
VQGMADAELTDRQRDAVLSLRLYNNRDLRNLHCGWIPTEWCGPKGKWRLQIFSTGWLAYLVLQGFSAVHIASVTATTWMLLLNAIVGFQILDDGTPLSMGLMLISSAILFIGTGYIALDTGFSWTGFFDPDLTGNNQSYSLYTLYQLVPLVFLFGFFCLETVLVLRVLREKRPMRMLLPICAHQSVLIAPQCSWLARLCSLLSVRSSNT